MGRRFSIVFTALVVGVVFSGVAFSGVPDPIYSFAPNVVVSPGGTMEYVVYVADSGGPIDSANVQIVFSAEAETLVCWCVGETPPIFSGLSDINGEAHFFLDGGGCVNPDSVAGSDPPVQVIANGVILGDVGVVSVDAVDSSGRYPTQGWDPMGQCTCTLADAISSTDPITTGSYDFCSDYNSDLLITLSDAVLITIPLTEGHFCVQGP